MKTPLEKWALYRWKSGIKMKAIRIITINSKTNNMIGKAIANKNDDDEEEEEGRKTLLKAILSRLLKLFKKFEQRQMKKPLVVFSTLQCVCVSTFVSLLFL